MTWNFPSYRGSAGSLAVLLTLAVLGLLTPMLGAAEALAGETATPLFADIVSEIVTDRSRMIQFSVVIVAFGIALLWWKK
jgi:hypothetical protein